MEERCVLLVREVKGKDDEHERSPRRHEPSAPEQANEQIHRQAREHEARECGQVVRGDIADEARREVGGVVREEHLQVVGVRLVPPERGRRVRVVCHPEHVVAPLMPLLPEARNRGGCVRTGIAEDRRAEVHDDRPEEHADEDDRPEEDQRAFRQDGAQPDEGAVCMPQTGSECRHARLDEELMRREEREADDDVRPHDAVQAGRDRRKCGNLCNDAGADDPRIARLAAREVVADEHVGQ